MLKNTLTHVYVPLDLLKYQDNSMVLKILFLTIDDETLGYIYDKKEPWPNPHVINSTQYWP